METGVIVEEGGTPVEKSWMRYGTVGEGTVLHYLVFLALPLIYIKSCGKIVLLCSIAVFDRKYQEITY